MPTLLELPCHQEILQCLLNDLIAHQSSDVEYVRTEGDEKEVVEEREVGLFLELHSKKLRVSSHELHHGKI